jgi:AcrR family transcriptional regulator
MSEDIRVRRTRRMLHQALLELTAERGYEAITVQDVLARAEIARSTFYAHFRDKDDLLLAGFKEMSGYLPDSLFNLPQPATDACPPFGVVLFRHVGERRQLARALISSSSGRIVSDHLRNLIVVAARKWLSGLPEPAPGAVPTELVVQHVASALFGLLVWWVDHDFPHTEEAMGEAAQALVMRGLHGNGFKPT